MTYGALLNGSNTYMADISDDVSLDWITLDNAHATLYQSGATLQCGNLNIANGLFKMYSGRIVNSSISCSSSGTFLFATDSCTLDTCTLSGIFGGTNSSSNLHIVNGLTLNGTVDFSQALSGQSLITFDGPTTISGSGSLILPLYPTNNGPLTIGSGTTVETSIGNNRVGNDAYPLVNNGTLLVHGASYGEEVYLRASSFTNLGLLEAVDKMSLRLFTDMTTAQLGRFHTTSDSEITTYAHLDNAGSTLQLDTSSGNFGVRHQGSVEGGTIEVADGMKFSMYGGTLKNVVFRGTGTSPISFSGWDAANPAVLDNVTLDASLTFGAAPVIRNGLTFLPNSNIHLNRNAVLTLEGAQTISGQGSIIFDGDNSGYPYPVLKNTGDLVIGSGVHLTTGTGGGVVGNNAYKLTNNGTITASSGSGPLTVGGANWVNNGTLEAVNGGSLSLDGTFVNSGSGCLSIGTSSGIYVKGQFDNSGQTFQLGAQGNFGVSGSLAKFTGGTIQSAGTKVSCSGEMHDVTLGCDVSMGSGGKLTGSTTLAGSRILGNYSFVANGTLGGTGSVELSVPTGSSSTVPILSTGGSMLTVGPDVTIRSVIGGSAGYPSGGIVGDASSNLINQGTLSTSGSALTISGGTFLNQGAIEALDDGTVTVNAAHWSNSGILRIRFATLKLGGSFTSDSMRGFDRQGGVVQVVGNMDNTGRTWTLSDEFGDVQLGDGSHITGGTIASAGAGQLSVVSSIYAPAVLDGVTLDTNLYYKGGATFCNGLSIKPGRSILQTGQYNAAATFTGDQTISGGGSFVGGIDITNTGQLTIGPGTTLTTGNLLGAKITGTGSLVNQGTIVSAVAGTTLAIRQQWTNQGLLKVTDGTLELGGTFLPADIGQLQSTGGRVLISGSLNNAGNTLEVSANHPFENSGTITGGIIRSTDGKPFRSYGTLDGVRLEANGALAGTIQNGLSIGNNLLTLTGSLVFPGTQTLEGTGTIGFNGADSTTLSIRGSSGGVLTIAPGITIECERMYGQVGAGPSTLINLGTVRSTIAGTSIDFEGTNQGVVRADNGGSISFGGDNQADVFATNGGKITFQSTGTNHGRITATDSTVRLAAGQTDNVTLSGGTFEVLSMKTAQAQAANFGANSSPTSVVVIGTLTNTGTDLLLDGTRGTWSLNSGKILGGTISSLNGESFMAGPGGTLDSVTSNAPISIPTGTFLTGTSLVNRNTITVSGGLSLNGAWDNEGTINCTGGSLHLGTLPVAWGNINMSNAPLYVDGTFTPDQLLPVQGTFSAVSVSSGGVINNVGTVLSLTPTTNGYWTLSGGRINGGTIRGVNGSYLRTSSSGSKLDGVTLEANATVASSLGVLNGLTLSGSTVTLQSGQLAFSGTNCDILGSGQIQAVSGMNDSITNGTSTMNIAPGIAIRAAGASMYVGSSGGKLVNQGLLGSDGPYTLTVTGQTVTNQGIMEARNGGTTKAIAGLSNFAGGILTGGQWNVYGNSKLDLGSSVVTTNAANVLLSGDNSVFAAINTLATNSGSFALAQGRDFTTAGALASSGQLGVGAGSVLSVSGSYTQSSPTSLLAMTLADNGLSGKLVVAGAANLGGILGVALDSGFVPSLGSSFEVIDYASAAGTFGSFQGLRLPNGLYLQPVSTGSSLSLTTIATGLPGDANCDGMVRFADYLILEQNFGKTGRTWQTADFNDDGKVSFSDYLLLEQNFGKSIPEPATLSLLIVAACAGLMRKRHATNERA